MYDDVVLTCFSMSYLSNMLVFIKLVRNLHEFLKYLTKQLLFFCSTLVEIIEIWAQRNRRQYSESLYFLCQFFPASVRSICHQEAPTISREKCTWLEATWYFVFSDFSDAANSEVVVTKKLQICWFHVY